MSAKVAARIETTAARQTIRLDRKILEDLYLKKRFAPARIAARLGVSADTVFRNLRFYEIPVRTKRESAGQRAKKNVAARIKS